MMIHILNFVCRLQITLTLWLVNQSIVSGGLDILSPIYRWWRRDSTKVVDGVTSHGSHGSVEKPLCSIYILVECEFGTTWSFDQWHSFVSGFLWIMVIIGGRLNVKPNHMKSLVYMRMWNNEFEIEHTLRWRKTNWTSTLCIGLRKDMRSSLIKEICSWSLGHLVRWCRHPKCKPYW